MRRFESSRPSHPVRDLQNFSVSCEKGPPMAGFSREVILYRDGFFPSCGCNRPVFSGRLTKYSRFQGTYARDRFDSTACWPERSEIFGSSAFPGVSGPSPACGRHETDRRNKLKSSSAPGRPFTFHEAAIKVREPGQVAGRIVPGRAIGGTLTLNGLEADIVVVLDAKPITLGTYMLTMTRGAKRLVICSREPVFKSAG